MEISPNSRALLRFMRRHTFVRYTRTYEEGFVRGYVLDVGPKFFLLALTGDVRFDGFSCHRIADLKNLKRDPYADFTEAALKKLGEKLPKRPKVSVASTEELLRSAADSFPLLTIHRQRIRPDVCWIGKLVEIKGDKFSLLQIGPDAKWARKATSFKLREITSIEFGGAYETALHLVGGTPHRQ